MLHPMKTTASFTNAVLILVFSIVANLSVFGNATLYEKENYEGKSERYTVGAYDRGDFRTLRNAFQFKGYCSIKIPSGYIVDLDYTGRGFEHKRVVSLYKSHTRIKRGFKKFRIRKGSKEDDEEAQEVAQTDQKSPCMKDWKVQFYVDRDYRGSYECFDRPNYSYFTSRHLKNYKGGTVSFKLRKGWKITFYDQRGRVVGNANNNTQRFTQQFYRFKIVPDARAGATGENTNVAKVDCEKNWTVQLYNRTAFRGQPDCFNNGQYYAGKDFMVLSGQTGSIKVKPGYVCELYDRRGQVIKSITGDERSVPGGFIRIVVKREGRENNAGNGPQQDCIPNWAIQVFSNQRYNGNQDCLPPGTHYAGRDLPNYGRRPISFKVKPGYIAVLFDRRGQVIQELYEDASNFRNDFYKVEVKRVAGNQFRDETDNDVDCMPNWIVKIFEDSRYNGAPHCFTLGSYFNGKDIPNVLNKPISFKIRKGYTCYIYDRYGKVTEEISRDQAFYQGDIYKFQVRRSTN